MEWKCMVFLKIESRGADGCDVYRCILEDVIRYRIKDNEIGLR